LRSRKKTKKTVCRSSL